MKKTLLLILLFSSFQCLGEGYSYGELVNMLKVGGYVVYFRHEQTLRKEIDKSHIDINEFKLRKKNEDCKTQRNLSPEGIERAKRNGVIINKLGIKISKIYSSPFCRCYKTAQNLTKLMPVVSSNLFFTMKITKEEKNKSSKKLKEMLNELPVKSTNIFLVSHTSNLKEAANLWPKPEGVAFIFKPNLDGESTYVGKILPDEWR